MPRVLPLIAALCAAATLSACDLLGDSPEKLAAAREAEGRAIGSACRQAARAIEDCFSMNKKADKASVFAGWRDMNDYMRENKMEAVEPQVPAPGSSRAEGSVPKEGGKAESKSDAKPEAKADTKAADASSSESKAEGDAPADDKRTKARVARNADH